MMHCVECNSPIDPNNMSFEMKLVDVQDFCRRCFDEIMADDGLPYLDDKRFMTVAV